MAEENRIFDNIIDLYYVLNPTMERVPVHIILTDDLNRTHFEIRPEKKNRLILQDAELSNDYNGRMIMPHSVDEKISILLNTLKMKQYTEDGSMTWIGTICHELTHAIDYYQMARKEALLFYDPLEEISLYQMFQLWSEYHARKLGYGFLREFFYRKGVLGDRLQQIRDIQEREWLSHRQRYYMEYNSGIDENQQMYITMQLLGRYSVWCDLFPEAFNEQAIYKDFTDLWISELLSFMRRHESLDRIYSNFDGLRHVLAKNWSV